MEVPTFFSEKKDIFSYDYNNVTNLLDSDINHYEFIDNLSVPDPEKNLCRDYFQSIMFGKNHIFIDKVLSQLNSSFVNVSLCE
jgi:hypothetical protein